MATGYDLTLTAKGKTWRCKLAGDFRVNTISDGGQLAINVNSENKRIGDFATQVDWKGGRGVERFSDNPRGYFDGTAWTLNDKILMSALQWRFGRGTRTATNAVEDFALPGSVKWQPIYAGAANTGIYRYYSRSWTAGASGNADKARIWLRRVGSPPTLTLKQHANSSGDPGTANKTVTKTISDITDTVSGLVEFDWTTTTALVSGTLYHLTVESAGTPDDHWEIAVDTSVTTSKYSADGSSWTTAAFGFYFMVSDAEYNRRLWYFRYRGLMYAAAQYFDGTASKLFVNGTRGKASSGTATTLTDTHTKDVAWTTDKWAGAYLKIIGGTGIGTVVRISSNTTTVLTFANSITAPDSTSEFIIYFTEYWAELTAGLTSVVSRPVVFNDIVYFPQGGAVNIRRMRFNAGAANPTHEFADDGTNKTPYLDVGINAASQPIIYQFNGTVSSSVVKAWGTALVFANAVSITGDPEYYFTNMRVLKNAAYTLRENAAIAVGPDNKPVKLNWGWEDSPSPYNGMATAQNGDYIYVGWGRDAMRIYGGQVQNIGVSWRGSGLPSGRQGFFRSFSFSDQWMYAAMESSGLSSALVYDGLAWHEICRGWKTVVPVRDVQVQNIESSFSRVWIDMGGYPVYIDMPSFTNAPYFASSVNYQHESVFISATIDNAAASRLKKTVDYITALTENLANGQRVIYVDYQFDNDVGSDNWIPSGDALQFSPEDTARIPMQNVTRFRYRLRMNTNTVTTPIVVREIGPNGMARTPYKLSWNLTVEAGDIVGSNKRVDADEMIRWLMECAQEAVPIRLGSKKYASLNDFSVMVSAPIIIPRTPAKGRQEAKSTLSLTFIQASQ